MPPIEDLEAPPLVDEYGSELQDIIIQHWDSIRTHTSHGPVQSRYNIRLMTSDIGGLELGHIFAARHTTVTMVPRAWTRGGSSIPSHRERT